MWRFPGFGVLAEVEPLQPAEPRDRVRNLGEAEAAEVQLVGPRALRLGDPAQGLVDLGCRLVQRCRLDLWRGLAAENSLPQPPEQHDPSAQRSVGSLRLY